MLYRDLDPGTEQALKKGIERMRTTSSHCSPPRAPAQKPQNSRSPESSESSSDSEGSSDSDKSNGDSSDDEDESALLEQMKQSKPVLTPTTSTAVQQEKNPTYSMPTGFTSNSNINRDKG